MKQLFYHKIAKKYLLLVNGEDLNMGCTVCKKTFEIGRVLYVHKSYSKKIRKISYLCQNCLKKSVTRFQDEYILAKLTTIISDNCILILDEPTQTSYGKVSTIEAAKLEADVTIDRTKYAGRESWHGARIGADVTQENKVLDSKEALKLLQEHKEGKLIGPKLIEGVKNDTN